MDFLVNDNKIKVLPIESKKEKGKSAFTGMRDIDLYIAEKLDDVSAMRFLMITPQLYNERNIAFVFGKRYPDLIRYREEGESLKALYLRMLNYIRLLKEEFGYIYCSGNPIDEHDLLDNYSEDINELLIESIIIGNLNLVKYALEAGAENEEVLMIASQEGYFPIVQYLVERGANIHAQDDAALIWASREGRLSVVKYLVERGANIHAEDDEALRAASANGHLPVVQYLVERGANIHAENDEALRWASGKGRLSVVKYLVEGGANIHAEDDEALRWASERGHLPVVKYLVESGANVNAFDNEALRLASEKGHVLVVQYLTSLE